MQEAPTPAAEEDDGNVGIFIKNLPWKVTEDDVAEFFADAGEVVNVRLGQLFLPPSPLPIQSSAFRPLSFFPSHFSCSSLSSQEAKVEFA